MSKLKKETISRSFILFLILIVFCLKYFNNDLSMTKNYFSHNFSFTKSGDKATTNKSIATPKSASVDPFCKTRTVFNTRQIRNFLKEFYNNTKLYYGQYRGPFVTENEPLPKKVPECYLKHIYVSLNEPSNSLISLERYREIRIKEFEKENSVAINEKVLCKNKRCVLQPYPKTVKRPKPEQLVKNAKKEIDEQAINAELKRLKEDGLQKGDDDLENLDFLNQYLNSQKNSEFKVPNLIHYIWFSCHEYKMSTYLCMLSALKMQNPEFILIHGDCEPKGKYWDLFKAAAGKKLKLVKKSPVTQIFGKKISVVEHQADVARLQVVLQVGGIYLDDDVVVLKSLDALRRDHDIVLGEASPLSVANGGIISNKNSWFLKRWFQQYQSFNDALWGADSVQTALALWQLFPEEVEVVQVRMMRPNWMEYQILHHGLMDWSDHWTVHLSTRYFDKFDRKRTLDQFARLRTSYGEIARFIFWGSPELVDVKEWVLHPDFDKV